MYKTSLYTLIAISSLLKLSSPAQAQQIVGILDNHTIVTGSQEVTTDSLMKTVEDDLKSQGVDPLNPKSGKYLLRFGTGLVRMFIYINAEKGRIRWENRTALLSFTPKNLPEQVLAKMMKAKRLRTLTTPSWEEYAAALGNELQAKGVNIKNPGNAKLCVKVGYARCKLSLTFTEDAQGGLLEWSYTGEPFMKDSKAEAFIRVLQSQGNFKTKSGVDYVVYRGDNLMDEEEKADAKKKSGETTEGKITSKGKVEAAKETKAAQANGASAAPQVKEAAVIKLSYSINDDYSDYAADDNDSGISVKGVKNNNPNQGVEGGSEFGIPGGAVGSNGTSDHGAIGIGGGNGNGPGGDGLGGIKTSLTAGTVACNSTVGSGGHGTTIIPMNFGNKRGKVNVLFATYAIPDEMIVRCNGHNLAQTGMFSGTKDFEFEFIPFGTGPKANTCQLIINGNENSGTAWTFGASCPGTRFTGNIN